MGWFNSYQDHYDQAQSYNNDQPDNQASLSHEVIAGAASFEAAKAWENHREANGYPVDHPLAKEFLAGAAGAAVDRLVETKGLDAWDEHQRNRARQQAQDQVVDQYNSYSSQQYSNDSFSSDQSY